MSKYKALWEYVRKSETQPLKLTFEEIQNIAGIPIDHSFLKYKKELMDYGYQVGKISMKEQTVVFNRIESQIQNKQKEKILFKSDILGCMSLITVYKILPFRYYVSTGNTLYLQ